MEDGVIRAESERCILTSEVNSGDTDGEKMEEVNFWIIYLVNGFGVKAKESLFY